jgi:hypothetical protein
MASLAESLLAGDSCVLDVQHAFSLAQQGCRLFKFDLLEGSASFMVALRLRVLATCDPERATLLARCQSGLLTRLACQIRRGSMRCSVIPLNVQKNFAVQF